MLNKDGNMSDRTLEFADELDEGGKELLWIKVQIVINKCAVNLLIFMFMLLVLLLVIFLCRA